MTPIGATKLFVQGIEQLGADNRPSVVSIGNFDGLHLGHQHVIKTLLEKSKELSLPATVVTFEPLAKEYFAPDSVARLTSVQTRTQLLFDMGVDQVVCVEFNKDLVALSPHRFVKDILVNGLGARYISVGDDFRFGKDRIGDFTLLQELGNQYDFVVSAHETFALDGVRVSSGRVREALKNNDFSLAERLLGRPYGIQGVVAKGQQMGRTLGFPTANILLENNVLAVKGVYAVTAELGNRQLSGVANVGFRPTVEGTEHRLEVFIFDFNQDIYAEHLNVTFQHKLRDEKKFSSLDELKAQIDTDVAAARAFFAANQI